MSLWRDACRLHRPQQSLNSLPLLPACTAFLGSPYTDRNRLPGLPLSPAEIRLQCRPPSPIANTMLDRLSYCAHKMMTLHSMTLPTMFTYNFCTCQSFSFSHIWQNCFILVEFRTSFFRVSTCFNGCAAAMDPRLGSRLR